MVSGTLADAVAAQEAMRTTELAPAASRLRLREYALRWLASHRARLAPSTCSRYVDAIAHVTAGGLGDLYVDALRPADVREWQARMAKAAAPATVNGWHRVLGQCLAAAVADGLLVGNPARAVQSLREGRTGGRRGASLAPAQFGAFVAAAMEPEACGAAPDLCRLVLTLAWSGMRRGEALALRWDDVSGGEIRVERSVWNGGEKSTKTDDPRIVPIPAPLADVLRQQRRWLVETQHAGLVSGLVFPADPRHAARGAERRDGPVRWYRSGSCLNASIRAICKAAGVPEVSAHALRRTWEDLLRRAGVDGLVRRSLAGWRSERAQAIYAGVSGDERAAACASVVGLVGGYLPRIPGALKCETPGSVAAETGRIHEGNCGAGDGT